MVKNFFKKLFFEIKFLWKQHVSGWKKEEVIDLNKWPEAVWMNPFEFEEFRKKKLAQDEQRNFWNHLEK